MSDYIPRFTSEGLRTNPHYTTRNPFYTSGFPMPNCTAYAWGRSWEISDPDNEYLNSTRPPLSTGNGQDFYPHDDDWPRGNVPALGAIACYAGGDFTGLGHVCVIEALDPENQRCRVSESASNGYFFRSNHWIAYNGDYGYGGYTFQGFIYNPFAGDTPVPGPGYEGFKLWKFKHLIDIKKGLTIV